MIYARSGLGWKPLAFESRQASGGRPIGPSGMWGTGHFAQSWAGITGRDTAGGWGTTPKPSRPVINNTPHSPSLPKEGKA